MHWHRWRRILVAALVAPALALLAVACGGGEPSPTPTPPATVTGTPTPTITPTPTGAGFLPTWTPSPTATRVPGAETGRFGDCPPRPRVACAAPGESGNVYEALRMDLATHLHALFHVGEPHWEWVLEPNQVAEVLGALDVDVLLEPLSPSMNTGGSPDGKRFQLAIYWPEWYEPIPGYSSGVVFFTVDLNEGVMGHHAVQLQWPIPPEFEELLFRYLSDVAPTPRPPPATVTPTPTIVQQGSAFFEHPDGKLRWDGPDERVYSMQSAMHCSYGPATDEFGVPGYFAVEDELGFFGARAVPRKDGWRWTGYYHGDWQVWQGDDPSIAYIVHAEEQRIAFEYKSFLCF